MTLISYNKLAISIFSNAVPLHNMHSSLCTDGILLQKEMLEYEQWLLKYDERKNNKLVIISL